MQPKSEKVIIYFSSDLDVKKYPNIINHLSSYKEKLDNRVETKSGVISSYAQLNIKRSMA